MKDPRTVLVRPLMTEKSMQQKEDLNVVTFEVATGANKVEIRQAVEKIFSVKVAAVRTSKVRPKPKRRGLSQGKTRGWKKAVVQLAPGERIELFEGAETA